MRRIFFHVVLPLLVGVASIANIVVYRLDNLLRPSWPDLTTASFYAGSAAVVILTAFAIWRLRGWMLALSMVLVIAAGFAPRIVDFFAVSQQQAEEQAEGADLEMQFQSALQDRMDDVEDRIATKKPYTADETLDFLEFAADADLSFRSLPDHTQQAFELLEEAIAGGIVDPNALTTIEPIADSPAVTVTVAFYDKRVRPTSPKHIRKHDWDVIEILAAHGADVGAPDAAALKADLAKTVSIDPGGRTIELK